MKMAHYQRTCPFCKRYIPLVEPHLCDRYPAKKGNLYHCPRCNRYLPEDCFNKDKTHRYGIMSICKECRKPVLKRQNKLKEVLRKLKKWGIIVE